MIRTQISLEPQTMAQLRQLARTRGVSIAALLREAVDRLLEETEADDRWARALEVSGSFEWEGSGRNHDADLADAFAE